MLKYMKFNKELSVSRAAAKADGKNGDVHKHGHKIVDLFCGVGGFSLAATRAGFKVVGAIDNDKHAIKAHGLNFPNTYHWQYDISELTAKDFFRYFDIAPSDLCGIVGGPPCQGFSAIGQKDVGDVRNGLFLDFFRLVAEARPKFFLAENVPGIMREQNNAFRKKAFSYLPKEYVVLPPMIFSANDYGAPTFRTRVFFVGYLPDAVHTLTADSFKPSDDIEKVHVSKALKGLPKKINPLWQDESQGWRPVRYGESDYFTVRLNGHIPEGVGDATAIEKLVKSKYVSGCLGTVHSDPVANRYAKVKPGKQDAVSKSYRLDSKGFCPTLRAGTGSEHGSFQAVRPLHPFQNRVITPREAARLQGFPDWFQFDATKWHSFRQIGNSVSPILAERIFDILIKAIKSNK